MPNPPSDPDRHLSELLVTLRLARPDQVTGALAERTRRISIGQGAKLERILVEQEILTEEQVRAILELRPEASNAPAIAPAPGPARVIADRYEVAEELGRGGMGIVYRALDRRLGRTVALKVLYLRERADPDEIQRFHLEARAAAALVHPGIVQVHDVGEVDGNPFYTMEAIAGRDLAEEMLDGKISPRDAVEIVRQVAEALEHAHAHGVLHRDIKPRNIILSHEPAGLRVRILDFGLAKFLEEEVRMPAVRASAPSLRTLTRSGELVGTPSYMSPEQVRGGAVDGRADVYSLGATLYEVLTGSDPFHGAPTLADLFTRICDEDPVPPRQGVPDLDRDLETLCLTCLRKEREARYASAGALAEDCRRWLAGEPIAARPVGRIERLWRRARRHPALASLLALVFLLVTGGTAVGVSVQIRHRAAVARARAETTAALEAHEFERALELAANGVELEPRDTALRGLLDRARAETLAAEGEDAFRHYLVARAEAARLHEEQRVAARTVEKSHSHAEKAPAWGLAARALAEDQRVEERFAEAASAFTGALGHWPEHPSARIRLADLYGDRLMEAERRGDRPGQAAYRGLIRGLSKDRFDKLFPATLPMEVAFLLPRGRTTGLRAYLYRYEELAVPPVLVPVPYDPAHGALLGAPAAGVAEPVSLTAAGPVRSDAARAASAFPLVATDGNRIVLEPEPGQNERQRSVVLRRSLPPGSYLLHFPAGQGIVEARYPFRVTRNAEWKEECELLSEDEMPPAIESGDASEWVFVPAGPFPAGGDALSRQTPPRDGGVVRLPENGVSGFLLARLPTTMGGYLRYLNDRQWHNLGQAYLRAPRVSATIVLGAPNYCLTRGEEIFFSDSAWRMDLPVHSISWHDAVDYCAWLTWKYGEERGWIFQLPDEDQWEKAARGVDGRCFPWGDEFDPTFCRMLDSREGEQERVLPEPWGLFPLDESPYGVRDAAGGMSEWTTTAAGTKSEWRIYKGGSWSESAAQCRLASRTRCTPEGVYACCGVRVAVRRTQ